LAAEFYVNGLYAFLEELSLLPAPTARAPAEKPRPPFFEESADCSAEAPPGLRYLSAAAPSLLPVAEPCNAATPLAPEPYVLLLIAAAEVVVLWADVLVLAAGDDLPLSPVDFLAPVIVVVAVWPPATPPFDVMDCCVVDWEVCMPLRK